MEKNEKNITKITKDGIVKGKIANAITSAAKNHIVATTDDIYDVDLEEYQDVINKQVHDIIPNEASSENQLADKQFVIDLLHNSSSAFRGEWDTWNDVPSDCEEYPEDGEGNRIPRQGDYIIVGDSSGYIGEDTGETYVGTWKFAYMGEWDVRGKDGWKPEYRINEEPDLIIDFRKKREGEPDENSTSITSKLITRHDVLTTYPELNYSEYVNGGYWDTNITDLRDMSENTVVYYITPFLTSDDNELLLKICYENGWSSSPGYLTIREAQSITDEMVKEAAKKLAVVEDENGNIVPVYDDIVYEEEDAKPEKVYYNLYLDLFQVRRGNLYVDVNKDKCFCYSKDGVKYSLGEVHYGNCFYELESWTELPYFTGITKLSDGETYRVFLDYSRIREINLENIAQLPAYTLFRCVHLENLYIPSGLTDIETYALASCDGLQSLVVDENNPKYTSRDSNGNECNCIVEKPVTTRGTRSAINNQLTLIQGCNVTILPDNIKHIASGAFDECTRLTSITLPDGLLTMGDNVFRGCTALSGNIVVPETVESIGESTFRNCTVLQGVNINTPSISNYLFKDCNSLSNVTLGNNVTEIGNQAFMNDSSLTAITIPDSVTVAGTSAFSGCDLRSINTNNIETISANLFAHNYNLSSVTMTDNTVNIGNDAFYMTTITGITIPQHIRNISNTAFEACYYLKSVIWDVNDTNMSKYISPFSPVDGDYQITSFEFGEHCTVIPNQLCRSLDGLEEIVIPNHITKIGDEAFAWCNSLVHLSIPDSVSYVGGACFGGCTSLETVTIGSGVTTIPTSCFVSCSSLETVDLSNNPNKINLQNINAFANCDNLSLIIVPDNLITDYRESQDWYEYREIIFGTSIYTITFDSVGGETTPSVQNVRCGAYIETPGTIHKDLYEFEYWEDENGSEWDFDEDYVIGDMTLYAHYREVKAIMVKSISNDVTNISMAYNGSYPASVEYSYDGLNWYNIWNNNDLTISLSEGYSDYVYFRGYNPNGFSRSWSNYTNFNINNGQCDLLGNIMYLKNYNEELDYVNNYEFFYLFGYCDAIVNADDFVLPATTLAGNCYQYMFDRCSSLTTAPSILPATTLSDYCYNGMFYGCTTLTTAPVLPATTLTYQCYQQMFYNCTSLTTAPELPATTLADYCYASMFSRCTSLTTAPELPATTLANGCYYGMFYNCSNLDYIKCLAVNGINQSYSTYQWVDGVQTNQGTFIKHPNTTSWPSGNNGIPTNWTVDDAVIE